MLRETNMRELEIYLLEIVEEHGFAKSTVSFARHNGFLSLNIDMRVQTRELVERLWDAMADHGLDSQLSDSAEGSTLFFYKSENEMEALIGCGPFNVANQALKEARIPLCFSWPPRKDDAVCAADFEVETYFNNAMNFKPR